MGAFSDFRGRRWNSPEFYISIDEHDAGDFTAYVEKQGLTAHMPLDYCCQFVTELVDVKVTEIPIFDRSIPRWLTAAERRDLLFVWGVIPALGQEEAVTGETAGNAVA